jgi:DMSO/TMAO reductase YedYZ molybdopterin-dependent catalytic subunit
MNRRQILTGLGAAAALGRPVLAAEKPAWMSPQLPDGTREEATLETLPGKRPLIRLASRPPNYEAPIDTFQTAITPNDRFFVRYHLAGIPSMPALAKWFLTVGGDATDGEITFGINDLTNLPQVEVAAVCQCSGNRRGLSSPHVAGVQWGYGAMGCATWRGPRLRDVLAKARTKADAVEVWLDGQDEPVLPTTPDFNKSLPMDKAMSDDVIVAIAMNGQPLPHLNGYPARVVVPGWTATYWMKHVSHIQLSTKPIASFWMQKAYRVPGGMFPVDHPFPTQDNTETWPITDIVVNSLVADPIDGTHQPAAGFTVQGVAWDRGHGIRQVEVSLDGGKSWKAAQLGKDLGRYAFRAFSFETGELTPGNYVVSSRATNNAGETQVDKLKFNPAGYHNNVPQQIALTVA